MCCGRRFAGRRARSRRRLRPSWIVSPFAPPREERNEVTTRIKKITGRKRHLAIDTLGLVLAVTVHGAYWQDHDGACFVLMRLRNSFHRLKVVFADSAYARKELPACVQQTFGWVLQTVLRPMGVKGFTVLPKRWIVERTFAWIARHRRHSKDYERNPETSEAMIYIAMISLMAQRLAAQ